MQFVAVYFSATLPGGRRRSTASHVAGNLARSAPSVTQLSVSFVYRCLQAT